LEALDLLIFKLNDQPARVTYHVIMMLPRHLGLVTREVLTDAIRDREACVYEELESPINRSVTYVLVTRSYAQIELFDGGVSRALIWVKEDLSDERALLGELMLMLLQISVEALYCLSSVHSLLLSVRSDGEIRW
jgi:hypothetical protein